MEQRLYAAFFALALSGALPGCQEEASKPAPAPRVEPTRPKPDVGAPAPPAPDGQEASKKRAEYLAALNKGRTLTKDKRYDEAIEVFEEALDLDPDNVPLLGELGWAAFLAGDYPLCDRMTNRALLFARKDKTRGMLLYNLGRSAEAKGEVDTARAHYEHSLRLRKNNTVKARLAKLDAGSANGAERDPTADPAPDSTADSTAPGPDGDTPLPDVSADAAPKALGIAKSGLADLEAACTWLIENRCDEVSTFTGDACRCSAGAKAQDTTLEAAVLTLATGEEGGAGNRAPFVAARVAKGKTWQLSEAIGWEYNPGAFGIFEELVISGLQLRTDLFQGESAALIEIEKERVDSNLGVNEVLSESSDYVVVCAKTGPTSVGCTRGLLRSFVFTRTALVDPEDDPEAPTVEDLKVEYKTELTFPGDGNVRSSASPPNDLPRSPPPTAALRKGDHSLKRLLE